MAKKKVEAKEIEYPEFGFLAKDEYLVLLVLESNSGRDAHKYLEHAKKLDRPIKFSIESELFDAYRFKNFALTLDEARGMAKELLRMVDYIEEAK